MDLFPFRIILIEASFFPKSTILGKKWEKLYRNTEAFCHVFGSFTECKKYGKLKFRNFRFFFWYLVGYQAFLVLEKSEKNDKLGRIMICGWYYWNKRYTLLDGKWNNNCICDWMLLSSLLLLLVLVLALSLVCVGGIICYFCWLCRCL